MSRRAAAQKKPGRPRARSRVTEAELQELRELLGAAGLRVKPAALDAWTAEQRAEASRYAQAILVAEGPRPPFIPPPLVCIEGGASEQEANPAKEAPAAPPSPAVVPFTGTAGGQHSPGAHVDGAYARDLEEALKRCTPEERRAELTEGALFVATGAGGETSIMWLREPERARDVTLYLADERDRDGETILGFDLPPWEALRLGEFLTRWAHEHVGPDIDVRATVERQLTAETLLEDVPGNLAHIRQKLDFIWYALEQACAPDGKRDMPREECQSSGRQAVYELLQALSAVEEDLKTATRLIACPTKSSDPKPTAARALPVAPAALPQMIVPPSIEQASVPELLLFALAGAGVGTADDHPLANVAYRLADELAMLSGVAEDDGEAVGKLLFHASQRAEVLAELLRRQRRGQ